jgi:prepilin-type processing-associated H-X9-DG protein
MAIEKIGVLELKAYYLGTADPETARAIEDQLKDPASEVNAVLRWLKMDWSVKDELLLWQETAAEELADQPLANLHVNAMASEVQHIPLSAEDLLVRRDSAQHKPRANSAPDFEPAPSVEVAARHRITVSAAAARLGVLAIDTVKGAATGPGQIVIGILRPIYRRLPRSVMPHAPAWWKSIGEYQPLAGLTSYLDSWFANLKFIEALVSIGVFTVMFLLLTPAIQSARESARRASCAYNLSQIALAANNYVATQGCYPGGSYSGTLFNPPHVGSSPENFSCFVRMLPYLDQQLMYASVNFNLTSADPANLTIAGVSVSSLICPSDVKTEPVAFPPDRRSADGITPGWTFNQLYPLPPGRWKQAFSSYGGNAGTFAFGFSNLMPPEILSFYQGVIYNDSSVKIADITDGQSNTFAIGERSKGQMYITNYTYAESDNSWNSGLWGDTLISSLYPVNLAAGNRGVVGSSGYDHYAPTSAGSFHPGGANFAFCDGSVRFINDSITSWTFNAQSINKYGDRIPVGTTVVTVPATAPYTKSGDYLMRGPNASPGVYQALSTRGGAEVVTTDSY